MAGEKVDESTANVSDAEAQLTPTQLAQLARLAQAVSDARAIERARADWARVRGAQGQGHSGAQPSSESALMPDAGSEEPTDDIWAGTRPCTLGRIVLPNID